MYLQKRFAAVIAWSALLWMTGCVGPMACGPNGANGPLAINSCGGCGDCEGCGELYIDPWINEPANCVDPCDKCGNHNGQSCGKCRSVFSGFESLWGYRCNDGCDSCGSASCGGGCCPPISGGALGGGPGDCDSGCGCASGCDGGCESCGGQDSVYIGGDEMMPPTEYIESTPTRAYAPSRSRQIFQPRGGFGSGLR
ncbi:MAG: hypothetical protein WBD31_15445 [Rubripirellula sp.]